MKKSGRLIQIKMMNRCVDEKGRLIIGKDFAWEKFKVTSYEDPKTHKTFAVVSYPDDNPIDDLLDELDTHDQTDQICGVHVDELEDRICELEQEVKALEELYNCLSDCNSVNVETMNNLANRIDKLDCENARSEKEKEPECQTE